MKNQQVTSPALIQFESFEWHYDFVIANRQYRIFENFGSENLRKGIEMEKIVYDDIPYLKEMIKKIPKEKLPVCDAVFKYNIKLTENISFAKVVPFNN